MRVLCSFVVACALMLCAFNADATTYYVDPAGNDANLGTSPGAAWATFQNVNGHTFVAGDTILLKAGGVWNNSNTSAPAIYPLGHGTATQPIKIDMYDPLQTGIRPIVNGGGNAWDWANARYGAAVYIVDEYWEIRNLEVTNFAASNPCGASHAYPTYNSSTPTPAGPQFVGIKAQNRAGHVLHHIYIGSVYVHDVCGLAAGFYGTNAGISVVADNLDYASYWDGVIVENSTVAKVDRIGIFVGISWQGTSSGSSQINMPPTRNVTIRNNAIDDSGGDGILTLVTTNALIEYNVLTNAGRRVSQPTCSPQPFSTANNYCNMFYAGIWSAVSNWNSGVGNGSQTVVQHNEVYNNYPAGDAEAFDNDYANISTTIQYNYSHNNYGGFLLNLEAHGPTEASYSDNLQVHFNISYNDGSSTGETARSVIIIAADGWTAGANPPDINNNTIYQSASMNSSVLVSSYGCSPYPAYIYNNILYLLGSYPAGTPAFPYCALSCPGGAPGPCDLAASPKTVVDHNDYYFPGGTLVAPYDSNARTYNPLLVAPGSAGIGINSLAGLRLRAGSPAITNGTNTGLSNMGSFDYWGTSVSPSAAPNIGAYDGPGESFATNYAFSARVVVAGGGSVETVPCSGTSPCWRATNLVDGQESSINNTYGFSSTSTTTSTTPSVTQFYLDGVHTFSKITLYPRNDSGNVGVGFPVDFTLSVWNGSTYLPRITRTAYPRPGNAPQVFTWGFSDSTDRVQLSVTRQGGCTAPSTYCTQLAEIEIAP